MSEERSGTSPTDVNPPVVHSRTSNPSGRGPNLPYLAGIDGLRAFAVAAVILYHAGASWLKGGFLGVEIFFAISGYLITSLLLAEWNQTQRVDLKAFWLRRARRLLPALYVLLITVLAVAVIFLPEEVASLRQDSTAAFFYVTNWYLIFTNRSYFELVGRPPLLQHLWSLAIEEQFYLLWPLTFAFLMTLGRRLRPWIPVLLVVCGITASALWMGHIYRAEVALSPSYDPSRVYYGADTRAAALLIGALFAFLWAPKKSQGRLDKLPMDLLGVAGLIVLLLCNMLIGESSPFLYQGGFALVSLATAVVVAAVVHPKARLLPKVLEFTPHLTFRGKILKLSWLSLTWIGVRSYGIYLWHWPIFNVTRPQLDVPLDGLPLFVLRLVLTFVAADLSFRFVEDPIRRGSLGRAWNTLRSARGVQRQTLVRRWGASAAALGVFFVILGGSVVNAQPPAPPAYLAIKSIDTFAYTATPESPTPSATATVAEPTATEVPSPTVTPTVEVVDMRTPEVKITRVILPTVTATPSATPTPLPTATATPTRTPEPPRETRVYALGDSVMLGAAEVMLQHIEGLNVDAAQSRQASEIGDNLRMRRDAGQLGSIVIIHIGNNGYIKASDIDEAMSIIGQRRVIMLNIKVPRQWETPNNQLIVEAAKRYANITLIDWRGATASRPELFWDDGYHLRVEGAELYTGMILAQLNSK